MGQWFGWLHTLRIHPEFCQWRSIKTLDVKVGWIRILASCILSNRFWISVCVCVYHVDVGVDEAELLDVRHLLLQQQLHFLFVLSQVFFLTFQRRKLGAETRLQLLHLHHLIPAHTHGRVTASIRLYTAECKSLYTLIYLNATRCIFYPFTVTLHISGEKKTSSCCSHIIGATNSRSITRLSF